MKESSFWLGFTANIAEVAAKSVAVGAVVDLGMKDMQEYGMLTKIPTIAVATSGIGVLDYYVFRRDRNKILNLRGEKKLVNQTMSALVAINPVLSAVILNTSIMSSTEKGVAFFGLALANAALLGVSRGIAELKNARDNRNSGQ